MWVQQIAVLKKDLLGLFIIMCTCEWVWVPVGGEVEGSDPCSWSHPTWMLGIDLGSCAKQV